LKGYRWQPDTGKRLEPVIKILHDRQIFNLLPRSSQVEVLLTLVESGMLGPASGIGALCSVIAVSMFAGCDRQNDAIMAVEQSGEEQGVAAPRMNSRR
jgi:hypothetical protein